MSKENVYNDYLTVRKMNADVKTKARILGLLVAQCINHWRVVGVTRQALNWYIENDFIKPSGRIIQRAHIVPRSETYAYLLQHDIDPIKFWEVLHERDKTILAKKGEYTTLSTVPIIALADQGIFPNSEEYIFFKSLRVGYRHREQESDLLRQTSQQYQVTQ